MTTGMDLLVSRRRAKLSGEDVARRMGVSRQYVSRLEQRDEVTPEAAEAYRGALRALEDDHVTVTIDALDVPADYRGAVRAARVVLGGSVTAASLTIGKTSVSVLAGANAPWQAVLGVVDAVSAIGVTPRIIDIAQEGDPVILKRVT